MSACQKVEDRLEALHDGELGRLARWRAARHVARCDRCRAEIDALRAVTQVVRESEGPSSHGPDLWAGIAARLPALDEELGRRSAAPARTGPERRTWTSWLRPLPVGVGGLAVAAAALLLWLRISVQPPHDEVIEDLDAMGRPVAVLPSDDKSTIIWVLDPKPASGAEEADSALL